MNVADRLQSPSLNVRYIKLGVGGEFARACFDGGYIGLGFDEQSHETCLRADWDAIRQSFLKMGKVPGKATGHTNELRAFYELGEDTLWITFAEGKLWWTFAEPQVSFTSNALKQLPRRRAVIDAWQSTDISDRPLEMRDLSTRLTTTSGYRSTICTIRERDYLLRKICGREEPIIVEAQAKKIELRDLAKRLIKLLHWRDFEILVDLIFIASGWRRVGVLGSTEADLDLLLEQSATGERAFVQVKSRATPAIFSDYVERFRAHGCERMFFVCHSPSTSLVQLDPDSAGVDIWLGDKLAEKALKAGLFDWIVERVR